MLRLPPLVLLCECLPVDVTSTPLLQNAFPQTGLVTLAVKVDPEMMIAAMQLMRGESLEDDDLSTSAADALVDPAPNSYKNTKLTIVNKMDDNR